MSCFDGRVEELRNVSVDCFQNSNIYSTTFFLSHCHTDHMEGLRSYIFLKRLADEAHVHLYCSEITALILATESTFAEVVHKIRALPIGVSSIVKIPRNTGPAEDVTVSLIPTGHCPGAVMFLFEGEMGRILYTGDFRLCEGDASRLRQLHYLDGTVKVIDKLYLDTTFLSRQYLQFPLRRSSISILCGLISSWLREEPDNAIYIQMPANYGSEAVFIEVAKCLGMKVHVKDAAYNIYKNIAEIREAVTDVPSCTRIHACLPHGQKFKTGDKTTMLPCQRKLTKLRIIRPCAMTFTSKVYDGSLESAVLQSADQELFRICYSSHCSYRELEHFVQYLKPRQIEACVIPRNMEAADVLQLLREVSRWGNGSIDLPVLTLSSRKGTRNGMSVGVTTVCSSRHTEQQNTITSHNETNMKEASQCNMQNEEGYVDSEIYRLIAEDVKPKVGDQDVDIRRRISEAFLETAAALNKPVVRESC